jgi:hypothetical protein
MASILAFEGTCSTFWTKIWNIHVVLQSPESFELAGLVDVKRLDAFLEGVQSVLEESKRDHDKTDDSNQANTRPDILGSNSLTL